MSQPEITPPESDQGTLRIDVSPGELLDKISILEIKVERISDPEKRNNVRHELDVMCAARDAAIAPDDEIKRLCDALRQVNEALWVVEDDLRDCERRDDFGAEFVKLARSVYRTNDRRAALKREINQRLGSSLIEEKAYAPY
jgi:hypothetical protein